MRSPHRRVAAAFVTIVGIGVLITFNGFLWTESDVEGSGAFHQARTDQKEHAAVAQFDAQPEGADNAVNLAIAPDHQHLRSHESGFGDAVLRDIPTEQVKQEDQERPKESPVETPTSRKPVDEGKKHEEQKKQTPLPDQEKLKETPAQTSTTRKPVDERKKQEGLEKQTSLPDKEKPKEAPVETPTTSKPTEKRTPLPVENEDEQLVDSLDTETPSPSRSPAKVKEKAQKQQLTQQELKERDVELVYTLHQVSQRTTQPRGVVLPMYENIAKLGMSLILKLRAYGVDLPVEIPMCGGDVSEVSRGLLTSKRQLGDVRVYDACQMAADTVSLTNPTRKVFCEDLSQCENRFRNFDIKLLSVFFSEFEEVMVLDADALFFQSPMPLWDSEDYRTTGTYFFNDRIVHEGTFLDAPADGRPGLNKLHEFVSTFKVELFKDIPTLHRPKATLQSTVNVQLPFEPSDILLADHAWKRRAGHHMDSSCVLWNKKRQPRATAVLLSFVAMNNVPRPPGFGDKELFFIACEVSEARYAFSKYATGAIGDVLYDRGDDHSRVCGSMVQYLPESPTAPGRAGTMLHLNTDNILTYQPLTHPMFYSKPIPADLYPGRMPDGRFDCPFDITIVKLTDTEVNQILYRQQLHEVVVEWINLATDTTMTTEQRETRSREIDGKVDLIFINIRELQLRG